MVGRVCARHVCVWSLSWLLLAGCLIQPANAADGETTMAAGEAAVSSAEQKSAAVWRAAQEAMIIGPADVPLRGLANIGVPESYGYVPVTESQALMEVMGNQVDTRFLGLIFPLSEKAQWFVSLDYEDSGYVKDDDARDWDADELLQSLKDGTEAANEWRQSEGFSPLEVTRWVEPPSYDSTHHRLVWSAEAKLRDEEDPNPGINVNTYVLGREGYISLNLITSAATVNGDKLVARELLKAVSFNEGKRYADFEPGSDRVAEYGLAALVGGIAAKKLGLLAVIAAFFVKFSKIILLVVAAFGAGFAKWWKGRAAGRD